MKFSWIEPGTCQVCDKEQFHVLNADNSADEYGACSICVTCALNAFGFAASTDFALITGGLAAIEKNEALNKDNAALIARNSELTAELDKARNST